MNQIGRAALAEAYGTFLLTLIGPGTIIAVNFLDVPALGSVTGAGLGFIGLAHGVALLLAVYTIGRISGAHINPAVTIAHWATRRIETKKVAPYILGQLAGATFAGFVQLALWTSSNSRGPVQAAQSTFLGDTIPSSQFGLGAVLLAEIIGTAILVFTVFGATDKASDQSRAGVTIGFSLAVVIWMFGPISGASLNPARTWGPTIASAVFSLAPFGNLWIYVVGPILGGLLGAFLYDVLR
ncbi:MAG TPA: MIP family channel protein [Candidatus Bathyarchaeia archaeon]|jgi:glycerol uptake facilitator protein|nr:MIP family channel protein [Candidatus Bathyarchaeia archaeon]